MCVAVLTLAGYRLTESEIKNGWRNNPDGGGFAYVKDGKVQIEKGLMTLETFEKKYEEIASQVFRESPMLVHFRIGTSGTKDANNTHPFAITPQVGPSGAMIHNGILFTPAGDWKGPKGDEKSDTRVVANAMNNILQLESVRNAKEELGMAIGKGNKFAFLYDDKSYVIVNEDQGYWENGTETKEKAAWFSNGSCRATGGRYAR